MGLIDIHVNECDVTDESHICLFQESPKYAVVKARHKEQCRNAWFEHANKADEGAQKAVEEEVEVVENEIKLMVSEQEIMLRVGQEEATQVPNDYALEQEYGRDWKDYFG